MSKRIFALAAVFFGLIIPVNTTSQSTSGNPMVKTYGDEAFNAVQ